MSLRKYDFKVLGQDLTFQGPDNAADINRIAGTTSAPEEAYMTLYCYSNRGPALRAKVAEAVEAQTGVKRKTEMVENQKTKELTEVFAETEQEYINRVQMTVTSEEGVEPKTFALSASDFVRIINEVNDDLGDWSPQSLREGKPAQAYFDKAQEVIDKIGAGKGSEEQTVSKIEAFLSLSFESTYGEFTKDNLARAIRDMDKKKRAMLKDSTDL